MTSEARAQELLWLLDAYVAAARSEFEETGDAQLLVDILEPVVWAACGRVVVDDSGVWRRP